MRRFTIGETNFGIDTSTSSFTLDKTDPDRPTITIEVSGDRSTFDPLEVEDDSEWSWALDPPGFYLREFPTQVDSNTGVVTAHVTLEDLDNHEFAIYMMEHNAIDGVDIKLVPDQSVEISGKVDLFGDFHDFSIKWQR